MLKLWTAFVATHAALVWGLRVGMDADPNEDNQANGPPDAFKLAHEQQQKNNSSLFSRFRKKPTEVRHCVSIPQDFGFFVPPIFPTR